MQPRDSLLSSSSTDDLWTVVSLDELSHDLLNVAGVNDDEDDSVATAATERWRDGLPAAAQPSSSTTTTTTAGSATTATAVKTKSIKTKPTRSVVRRNERERNRVKQVNDFVPSWIWQFAAISSRHLDFLVKELSIHTRLTKLTLS